MAVIVGSLGSIRDRMATREWQGEVVQLSNGEKLSLEHVLACEALLEQHSVAHGDAIVMLMSGTLRCVAAMVAAWSAGLVVVPVRGAPNDPGVSAIAADCGARLILEASTDTVLPLCEKEAEHRRFVFRRRPNVAGTDLALIIYTSGSTGIPKGIMLTHANIISALSSISSYLGLSTSDRILCLPPISFDYGLYQILFAFHADCATLLPAAAFNPLTCVQTSARENVTIWPLVPSMGVSLARLLSARPVPVALPSLRLITNTGGHLPVHVIETLARVLPTCGVCAMYGLSESKRALFLAPVDALRLAGSVGKPMPGLAAAVFEEVVTDGQSSFVEVEDGKVGELFVRGASVMQGYRSGDGGGSRIIPGRYRDDNWLATGDLFVRDAEGNYCYRGRSKELIKQDGFCIYPRDVEQLAEAHPEVDWAVVFGVEDQWGAERACLIAKRADPGLDEGAFKRWLFERVGPDQRPRVVRLVDDVPLSVNGKPDRRAMRALLLTLERIS